MNFPLYKDYYKFDINKIYTLANNFNPIIKFTTNDKQLKKYKHKYIIIYDDWNKTQELNSITDYFTLPIRIQCKVMNNKSPIEYWNKNKNKLLSITKDKHKLKELVYKNVKFCNNFRITVILTILQKFKVKKYLDISAGWGYVTNIKKLSENI